LVEIALARSYGLDDLIEQLREEMETERKSIFQGN